MKILLAGDSFAVNWPNSSAGWPTLLGCRYNVTNIAQAGVSEYKILKQIHSELLTDYDLIIVCHTSPNRVHTITHPVHKAGLHKDCDLIFTDIDAKASFFNKSLSIAKGWFRYHYDEQYQLDIYNLIRAEIDRLITIPYISIDNFDIQQSKELNHLDFSKFWPTAKGTVNHYSDLGNQYVFNEVVKMIDKTTKKSV